jgi:hypothetical protein
MTVADGSQSNVTFSIRVPSPRPLVADCWVVYVERLSLALQSSLVILVSKRSGKVVYLGSANDEG